MDPLTLLAFALASGLANASPGPAVAALLARVLARGSRGIAPFCAGLVVGDMIWLSAAILGLSVLAQTAQPVFEALKWLGVGYLLLLAFRLWTAPAAPPIEAPPPRGEGMRLFGGAVLLTLGNPKPMIFYTAIAPAVVDFTAVTPGSFTVLQLTLAVVYSGVLLAFVRAADRARKLVRDARAMRRVNQACGATMAGAAVAVAAR